MYSFIFYFDGASLCLNPPVPSQLARIIDTYYLFRLDQELNLGLLCGYRLQIVAS